MPWSVASDPANRGRFPVDVDIDFAIEARNKKWDEYKAAYPDADLGAYVMSVGEPPPATE